MPVSGTASPMLPVLQPKIMVASLAVAMAPSLVQATTQPPVTGFFADPIVATLLRVVSIVLSLALSGTIILACIKMIAYFGAAGEDRKSTRLNSSHMSISYAVFCLKKKKKREWNTME